MVDQRERVEGQSVQVAVVADPHRLLPADGQGPTGPDDARAGVVPGWLGAWVDGEWSDGACVCFAGVDGKVEGGVQSQ